MTYQLLILFIPLNSPHFLGDELGKYLTKGNRERSKHQLIRDVTSLCCVVVQFASVV
jgi:hypothetical protein